MADNVNRGLKVLLILVITLDSVITNFQQRTGDDDDDDLYGALSDLLADDKAISPGISFQSGHDRNHASESRTIRSKPHTKHKNKARRTSVRQQLKRNHGQDQTAGLHDRSAFPAVEHERFGEDVSLDTQQDNGRSLDETKPEIAYVERPAQIQEPDRESAMDKDSQVIAPKPSDWSRLQLDDREWHEVPPRTLTHDSEVVPRDQPELIHTEAPVIIMNNDPCEPNPCQNGGTCRRDKIKDGTYQCACPLQYRGKFCHEVMAKCDMLGCRDVTDCVSAPSGAVCICKGTETGRLCQLDVESQTEWEKFKMVVSEKTVFTGEIVIACIISGLVLLAIILAIHCHRVNARRAVVRKRYQDVLDRGIAPSEPPPDWCDISNDMIKLTFCCKTASSLVDDYDPRRSLSRIQSLSKQKEDELLHLLNSRTSLPPTMSLTNDLQDRRQSYSLLDEIDDALGEGIEENPVSPQQIDMKISRRTPRNDGLNGSVVGNRSLNNRYFPGFPSNTRQNEYGIRQTSHPLKPVYKYSESSVQPRPAQTQPKQAHERKDDFQGKTSRKSQRSHVLKKKCSIQISSDNTSQPNHKGYRHQHCQINRAIDDGSDKTLEPEYDHSYNYYNRYSRKRQMDDKSHNAYGEGFNQNNQQTENPDHIRTDPKYQKDFEKRMKNIRGNLETLKSTIDQRNFRHNTNTNSAKSCDATGLAKYHMRTTTRKEIAVESTASDESSLEEKSSMKINLENDKLSSVRLEDIFGIGNGNLNEYEKYLYNYTDQIYDRNLNNYRTSELYSSHNDSPYRIMDGNYRYFPNFSCDHLVDRSIDRDDLETIQSWNSAPEYTKMWTKYENTHDQSFESTDDELKPDSMDSNCRYDNSIVPQSCKFSREHKCDANVRPTASGVSNEEIQHILYMLEKNHSDKTEISQIVTKEDRPFLQTGSESFGILSTNAFIPPTEGNLKNKQLDNCDNGVNEDKGGINNVETSGHDAPIDEHYISQSGIEKEKEVLVSEKENSKGFNRQTALDANGEVTQGTSRQEHGISEFELNYCTSPTNNDEMCTHKSCFSAALDNTPSTIVGTANTTQTSCCNADEVILIAESNASDTEIEL